MVYLDQTKGRSLSFGQSRTVSGIVAIRAPATDARGPPGRVVRVAVVLEQCLELLPSASGKLDASPVALRFENFNGLLGPGGVVWKVVSEGRFEKFSEHGVVVDMVAIGDELVESPREGRRAVFVSISKEDQAGQVRVKLGSKRSVC